MISPKLHKIYNKIIDSNKYHQFHSKHGSHIAVLMYNTHDIISIGVNHVKLNRHPIHAEIDACHKLKPRKNKKTKRILILVFRLSKTNIVGESRPCLHCLMKMNIIAQKKGYKIHDIIYSTSNKTLVKERFIKLRHEKKQHITYYWKKRNFVQ